MNLPQEILERIAYFCGGYVCCVLGINLRLPMLREMIFREGGPGVILGQILDKEVDIRALLTIQKHVPPELAIARAVLKKDEALLKRVFAIWDTRWSDLGYGLSITNKFTFGVDHIRTRHIQLYGYDRNKYFAEIGQPSKMDLAIEDPYRDVICVSHLTRKTYKELENISTPQTMLNIAGYLGYLDHVYRLMDENYDLDLGDIFGNAPMDVAILVHNRYGDGNSLRILHRLHTLEDLNLLSTNDFGVLQKKAIINGDVDMLGKYLRNCSAGSTFWILKDYDKLDMLDGLFEGGFISHDLLLDVVENYGLDIFITGKWSGYVTRDMLRNLYSINRDYAANIIVQLIERDLVELDELSFQVPSVDEIKVVTKKYGKDIIKRYNNVFFANTKDFVWFWDIFGDNYVVRDKTNTRWENTDGVSVVDDILYFGQDISFAIPPSLYHRVSIENLVYVMDISVICQYYFH